MMKRLFPLLAAMAVLLPLFFFNVNASPPDGCLKMVLPNDAHSEYDSTLPGWKTVGSINPDSVKIDSCAGSPTFGKMFANRYFQLQMNNNYYPFDKVIDTSDIFEIDDISNSKLELKQQLLQLESNFGKVYFRGTGYEYLETEENILGNPVFRMFFRDYQDVAVVEQYVYGNLDSIKYFKYNNLSASLVSVKEREINLDNIKIEPIPARNSIKISFQNCLVLNNNLELYNVNGLRLKEIPFKEEINISDLPNGVYFIKCGNIIGKFIKE